jgi:hypothetical protein
LFVCHLRLSMIDVVPVSKVKIVALYPLSYVVSRKTRSSPVYKSRYVFEMDIQQEDCSKDRFTSKMRFRKFKATTSFLKQRAVSSSSVFLLELLAGL